MASGFTSGPSASNVQASSFDTDQTPNQDGTVYGIVIADGASAPSNLDVKNNRLASIGDSGVESHVDGTNFHTLNHQAADAKHGQTFPTPSSTAIQVDSVEIEMIKLGVVAGKGNVYVEIWDVSAGQPNAIVDNGKSNGYSADNFTTTPTYHTFTFPNKPELSADSTYAIVVYADWAFDANNYLRTGRSGLQVSYSAGEGKRYNSDTDEWSNLPGDINFKLNYHEVSYSSPLDNDNITAIEDQENTLSFSGLSTDTSYDAYILLDGSLDGLMATPVKVDVSLSSAAIEGNFSISHVATVAFTGQNIAEQALQISHIATVAFTGTRKADQSYSIQAIPVITFTGTAFGIVQDIGVRTDGYPITLTGEVKGTNLLLSNVATVTFTGASPRKYRISHPADVVFTKKKITTGALSISQKANISITGNIITELTIPAFWPTEENITFADVIFLDKLGQHPVSGTNLRYTLDGSTPDENSPIYVGGIEPASNSFTVKAAYINAANEIVAGTLVSKSYTVSPAPIKGSFIVDEFYEDFYAGNINLSAKTYKVAFYGGGIAFNKQSSTYDSIGELSPDQCANYPVGGFTLVPNVVNENEVTTLGFNSISIPEADSDVGYSFQYLVIYDPNNFNEILFVLDLKKPVIVNTVRSELLHFDDLFKVRRVA